MKTAKADLIFLAVLWGVIGLTGLVSLIFWGLHLLELMSNG